MNARDWLRKRARNGAGCSGVGAFVLGAAALTWWWLA